MIDLPPAWRDCLWPDCPARLDIAAVMNGDLGAYQPGWLQRVLSTRYLCPEHAMAGHLPYRQDRRVGCECGWRATSDSATLGAMHEVWQAHVLESLAGGA